MRLLDPARPVVGGKPQLLHGGRPICAIPGICTDPATGRMAVHTCYRPNCGTWFKAREGATHEEILAAFREDPEACLQTYFGWVWQPAVGPGFGTGTQLSLDDILA